MLDIAYNMHITGQVQQPQSSHYLRAKRSLKFTINDIRILRKLGGTYIDEPSLPRKMSVSMRAGETRHQRLRRTGTHPAFLQCVVHVG